MESESGNRECQSEREARIVLELLANPENWKPSPTAIGVKASVVAQMALRSMGVIPGIESETTEPVEWEPLPDFDQNNPMREFECVPKADQEEGVSRGAE